MQSNNKNFVFVVLDALRGDHINKRYMPFLHSLKSRSIFVKSLNVSSGFCERSEIFFGQCPRESGFVHAISPNSEIKPYSWLSARKARFLMIFELTPVLKKILRRVLRNIYENPKSNSYGDLSTMINQNSIKNIQNSLIND